MTSSSNEDAFLNGLRHLSIEAPSRSLLAFVRWELARVPPNDRDDFFQLIFLECLAEQVANRAITVEKLRKAIHRIRKRLTRSITREKPVDPNTLAANVAADSVGAESLEVLLKALDTFRESASGEDMLLLHLIIVERRSVSEAAKELGISRATAYRRLAGLKRRVDPE